jgi:sugar phosphate isomerase/epimerase
VKYAAQLYTVRDFVKTSEGLHDSLKKIADMGYEGVQISAVEAFQKDVSAEQLRRWLDGLNLACCATHRPWDNFVNDLEVEIKTHQTLGCEVLGIGMGPKVCIEGGPVEWRKWLAKVDEIVKSLAEHDLTFAYHNHAIEFEKKDSERGIDILVAESNEEMQFILDTYWVIHSGTDCVDMIQQLRGRLDCVHLKDKTVVGWETRYAPVGEGNLPWHSILPALEDAGTKWGIVEQDECYGDDPFDCLHRSLKYLKSTE